MATNGTVAPATPKAMPCVQLPCPCCGEEVSNISLQVWALDEVGGNHFHCHECDAEFSMQSVRTLMRRWGAFLAWVETIPTIANID